MHRRLALLFYILALGSHPQYANIDKIKDDMGARPPCSDRMRVLNLMLALCTAKQEEMAEIGRINVIQRINVQQLPETAEDALGIGNTFNECEQARDERQTRELRDDPDSEEDKLWNAGYAVVAGIYLVPYVSA
ncbi:hypothetical protein L210DRAFT_3653419 [Boletus edulis BED1]|uniref:Uncharacterized protein n=1 Tax=Boletus edulis BED1 TaxID=1328754 RepID=A0AAD4G733_BOLED|nr:hypothetical protein L210DRAFT_3653419 [Boletus edulis BED1]